LHVWLPLPEPWGADDFVSHARLQGVAVAAGSSFSIGEPSRHSGVRVCLGGASDGELARGLEILARLARNRPEQALLAV
jgi:DNA-binding transcriptional MocR family regulator